MMDVDWFKREYASNLMEFRIEYKFFEDGDFGALNQVIFESPRCGGEVGFWGLGWLTIFLWDYEEEKVLLNLHLEPTQRKEMEGGFNELKRLIETKRSCE